MNTRGEQAKNRKEKELHIFIKRNESEVELVNLPKSLEVDEILYIPQMTHRMQKNIWQSLMHGIRIDLSAKSGQYNRCTYTAAIRTFHSKGISTEQYLIPLDMRENGYLLAMLLDLGNLSKGTSSTYTLLEIPLGQYKRIIFSNRKVYKDELTNLITKVSLTKLKEWGETETVIKSTDESKAAQDILKAYEEVKSEAEGLSLFGIHEDGYEYKAMEVQDSGIPVIKTSSGTQYFCDRFNGKTTDSFDTRGYSELKPYLAYADMEGQTRFNAYTLFCDRRAKLLLDHTEGISIMQMLYCRSGIVSFITGDELITKFRNYRADLEKSDFMLKYWDELGQIGILENINFLLTEREIIKYWDDLHKTLDSFNGMNIAIKLFISEPAEHYEEGTIRSVLDIVSEMPFAELTIIKSDDGSAFGYKLSAGRLGRTYDLEQVSGSVYNVVGMKSTVADKYLEAVMLNNHETEMIVSEDIPLLLNKAFEAAYSQFTHLKKPSERGLEVWV